VTVGQVQLDDLDGVLAEVAELKEDEGEHEGVEAVVLVLPDVLEGEDHDPGEQGQPHDHVERLRLDDRPDLERIGEQRGDDHHPQRQPLDLEHRRQRESREVGHPAHLIRLGPRSGCSAWRSRRCLRAISEKTTASTRTTKAKAPTATIQSFCLNSTGGTISGCRPTVSAKYQASPNAPAAATTKMAAST